MRLRTGKEYYKLMFLYDLIGGLNDRKRKILFSNGTRKR
jgi:hypothetical protein